MAWDDSNMLPLEATATAIEQHVPIQRTSLLPACCTHFIDLFSRQKTPNAYPQFSRLLFPPTHVKKSRPQLCMLSMPGSVIRLLRALCSRYLSLQGRGTGGKNTFIGPTRNCCCCAASCPLRAKKQFRCLQRTRFYGRTKWG